MLCDMELAAVEEVAMEAAVEVSTPAQEGDRWATFRIQPKRAVLRQAEASRDDWKVLTAAAGGGYDTAAAKE